LPSSAASAGGLLAGETPVRSGDREEVLHRGLSVEPADLDPHLVTDTSYYTVLSSLLEGLTAEDPVDLHPVPGVAESWDVAADGAHLHLSPEGGRALVERRARDLAGISWHHGAGY
jgi:ABC-type oligopeptide transport system substrate-binding subunit